jgi:hypothetical protein
MAMNSNNSFFEVFREKDIVTVAEIYQICDKKPDGKRFIQNRVADWKKKGVARPLYERRTGKGAYKTLIAVAITKHGASYFSRTEGRGLTLEQIFDAAAELRKQHPHFDIRFEIKVKEGPVTVRLKKEDYFVPQQ